MFNLLSKLRAAKAEKAGRLARKAAWDAHQVAETASRRRSSNRAKPRNNSTPKLQPRRPMDRTLKRSGNIWRSTATTGGFWRTL